MKVFKAEDKELIGLFEEARIYRTMAEIQAKINTPESHERFLDSVRAFLSLTDKAYERIYELYPEYKNYHGEYHYEPREIIFKNKRYEEEK